MIFINRQQSTTLDPTLAAHAAAFATWRDATGEWLVMGGKDGAVMLPSSMIRASLFAASNPDAESGSER